MKNIKKLLIAFSLLGLIFSCTKNDTDLLTGNKDEGGLLTVKNNLIGYVVGNGNSFQYKSTIVAFQSNVKVTSVAVYKQFTNTSGVTSNKALLASYSCPTNSQNVNLELNFTYPQLISGLSVNGSPISSDDTLLNIGDYWTLTYVTTTDDGQIQENSSTTKVAVGTRFAGNYKCITGSYWRIGVLTYSGGDWPSSTTIESVNSTTYRVKTYFGPFTNTSTATGGDYYFTIDSNDNIAYPATTPDGVPQEGNLQPFITCSTNPNQMTNVNCGSSNFVTRDNDNGKDRLTMSFGYLAPSGPREFYQVMEKIVE
jgi:hypothetical protein